MTLEERKEINRRIDVMIGSREQEISRTANWRLEARVNNLTRYDKMRAKLFKLAEKEGIAALSTIIIKSGKWIEGVTASGKKYIWDGNNGYTERSRYCGSLWIEGVGTVFTSGAIDKAVEYLLKN
jgi:hypothetical protein